jgi:hypothetical protein
VSAGARQVIDGVELAAHPMHLVKHGQARSSLATSALPTTVPGLGPRLPHLHWDWAWCSWRRTCRSASARTRTKALVSTGAAGLKRAACSAPRAACRRQHLGRTARSSPPAAKLRCCAEERRTRLSVLWAGARCMAAAATVRVACCNRSRAYDYVFVRTCVHTHTHTQVQPHGRARLAGDGRRVAGVGGALQGVGRGQLRCAPVGQP